MLRPLRRLVPALLAAAAAAGAGLPILAMAGPSADAPDLRADPVERVEGPNVYSNTEGGLGNGALLVRFDGFVTNVGQGPLEVRGNPQIAGGMKQYARTSPSESLPSVVVGTPEVKFEAEDSHNHWHLMRAMRYSLWNLEKTAQVAPGQKVGFCLYDIQRASGAPVNDAGVYSGEVTRFCEQEASGGAGPAATSLRMGTSAGWRDVYDKGLAYQWIDVSNTRPGVYLVGAEADPDDRIWEGGGAAEVNPPAFASQPVTVPGWIAGPVQLAQTGSPQAVALTASKFGSQSDANLRYRIVSGPAHGTLSVPTGSVLTEKQPLTYTPAPGYTGPDSFAYAALSAASPFPLSPPTATVSFAGRSPSVALSGAPASMVAGTSVQLAAYVANAPPGVVWSASSGGVSPDGLYTAPGSPPPGGEVVVRVAAAAEPTVTAEARIAISPAPKSTARPDVRGRLWAGRRMLSPLKVTVFSRRTLVAKIATGPRRGRVVITATFGRRVVGRCGARKVPARRTVTCKITLKRSYPLKRVRITAKFTSTTGGKRAVRRTLARR